MIVEKALSGTGNWLDERFHGARGLRTFFRKIFHDHWMFLLCEIALYPLLSLILCGTFLAFFYKPSIPYILYHGAYVKLDGMHMREAYASALRISFGVRGGVLIR